MKRLAFLLFLLCAGCATNHMVMRRVAELHVGMTQQEVTDLLGKPQKVTNVGALTTYDYVFTQPVALHDNEPPTVSYWVIIGRDGRVRSFGQN